MSENEYKLLEMRREDEMMHDSNQKLAQQLNMFKDQLDQSTGSNNSKQFDFTGMKEEG